MGKVVLIFLFLNCSNALSQSNEKAVDEITLGQGIVGDGTSITTSGTVAVEIGESGDRFSSAGKKARYL